MNYAEIYVDIKTLDTDRPFDYKIPDFLKGKPLRGCIVRVPFGNRTELGYVSRIKSFSGLDGIEIREIKDIISPVPVFDKERLRLIFWMCAYYVQPFSKIAGFFLPPGNIIKAMKTIQNESPSARKTGIKRETAQIKNFQLNSYVSDIKKNLEEKKFSSYLFQSLPDSDKMSLILEICSTALNLNKRVIIIAPELAGAYKIGDFLSGSNLSNICINDYEKTEKERVSDWKDIFNSNFDIILGSRSSLFLPFKNPGIVIADDVHDLSYKESTMARYNAQDVLLRLAGIFKIPAILFSPVPPIDLSYHFKNRHRFISIDYDAENQNKYAKIIIDLKKIDHFKEDVLISNKLFVSISNELAKNNKIILFFNKRGYSTLLVCKKCGNIPRCPSCNITYRYHSHSNKLVCHHCSNMQYFDGKCPDCGSDDISLFGEGIEKLENKLKKRFKTENFYRVDSDSIKNKSEMEDLINKMKIPGPGIILGTQMLLKDMGIKNITLAVVMDFENLIYLPDFTVNERAFQAISSLGSLLDTSSNYSAPKIIIQTYNPENFIIRSFISGGYKDFYEKEIESRKELEYPPFSNLVNIIISGRNEEKVKKDISSLFDIIKNSNLRDSKILGPAQAPFYKINTYYRYHLLVKTKKIMKFNIMLGKILSSFNRDRDNKLIVDVDPAWIL